jgi:ubiquinone/menaquinone biosynthesis C-methylase UbiE
MTGAPLATPRFDDSEGYERFMGAWSRAATPIFLDWLAAPRGARWLDVGCGTGILAHAILDTAGPASIEAVDPTAAQLEYAAQKLHGSCVRFQVAEAEALPFPDSTFEAVASALVINFLRDRPQALREMRRVARPGAIVGGFVWDFSADRSPSGPMRTGLRAVGAAVPPVPGSAESTREALHRLFDDAGLDGVVTHTFEVTVSFPSFDDFWHAQLPTYNPVSRTIQAMSEAERLRVDQAVRHALAVDTTGAFAYSARVNAVKGIARDA